MKLDRTAALLSLVVGSVAGCFSLETEPSQTSQTQGCSICSAPGPRPANATAGTDNLGCAAWVCDPGFAQCSGAPVCGVDLISDPHHCGACDNDCGGGSCTEGSCHPVTVLAEGLPDSSTVAVDPTFVYVATSQGIQRVAKTGGALETFAPSLSEGLDAAPLAADASGVYWVDLDESQLLTATAPGQAPTVVASGLGIPLAPLLLDATYVYWMDVEGGEASGSGDTSNIWRAPKSGGGQAELVSNLSSTQFYLSGAPLATSMGRVAFVDMTSLEVVGPSIGPASTVTTQSPGIEALAADDQTLFWIAGPQPVLDSCLDVGGAGGSSSGCSGPPIPEGIFSVPWSGGAPHTVSSTGGLTGLVVSGGTLWGLGGGLTQVDVASGVHALFAGDETITGFALDATRVYWARGGKVLASPL